MHEQHELLLQFPQCHNYQRARKLISFTPLFFVLAFLSGMLLYWVYMKRSSFDYRALGMEASEGNEEGCSL
jgi:hypothetical protein